MKYLVVVFRRDSFGFAGAKESIRSSELNPSVEGLGCQDQVSAVKVFWGKHETARSSSTCLKSWWVLGNLRQENNLESHTSLG